MVETSLALNTLTAGSGPGRALVLHGLSSSAETMGRITDALATGGEFTVVAPDLRGHGRSPRGERYGTDDYVGDLDALGHWDLVVGHSLGGLIGLCAARRPGWTRGLVLLDPALEFTPAQTAGHARDERAELTSMPTVDRIRAANPRWSAEDAQLKANAVAAMSVDALDRTFRDVPPWEYAGLLHTLAVPTLVLGADPAVGAVFPAELGTAAAEANPQVSFRVLAGTGHSVHRDDPAAVIAEIVRFAEHHQLGRH